MSRPVENICKDCYTFANRHRYLANHTMGRDDDDGDGDGDGDGYGNGNGNGDSNGNGNGGGNGNSEGEHSNDGRSNEGNNDDGSNNIFDVGVRPIRNLDLNHPEAASTKVDKERELMLLQAVVHIKNGKGTESPLPGQGGRCGCRCNCKEITLGTKKYFCC